jgi:hypothetical protein
MEDMSASEIWLIQLLSKVEINITQLWEQGGPRFCTNAGEPQGVLQ